MTFEEYQQQARKTLSPSNFLSNYHLMLNGVLGILGEAGEIADHLKKHYFQGHDFDREHLIEEIGDVLWYLSALCDALETTLDHVAEYNVRKLAARYPTGKFRVEDSINRKGGS